MLRFKLNEIAERPKGTRVVLPKIEERRGAVESHRESSRLMLREAKKFTRDRLFPEALSIQSGIRDHRIDDAGRENLEEFRRLIRRLTETSTATVQRILRLEAERHTARFSRDVMRALSIDLRAIIRDEDLGELLDVALARNVSLIRDLGTGTARRVEQTLFSSISNGFTARDLGIRLTEDFAIESRRARNIARDQIAKFNSDLNRIRHEQAGVSSYVWSTSRDERVRARHRAIDGREYRYGESTAAEGGLGPGQPPMCRCVGLGVVVF